MKYIYLIVFTVLIALGQVNGQSDGCSFSPAITVTPDCTSPTSGTSAGATQTIPGCSGNADDDVWYEFVATSTSHYIEVSPSGGYDPVLQVFSNTCSSLTSIGCIDNFGTGITENFTYTGLTIGVTYKIRIYHYGAGSGTGTFDICVSSPSAPPANDACVNAISLNVNSSCVNQSFNNDGATNGGLPGCAGNADDDVWFSFTATNAVQTITVDPIDNIDLVIQLYGGNCAGLSTITCMDNTFTGDAETINAVGLTPGQTYYIRVYDYYAGYTGDFNICIVGTPTPAPTNDEPCNAILMPDVTSACNYSTFNNVGATASTGGGIPTPSSCAGGSGAAIGGFSTSTADVWFKFVVPATGSINITSQPNLGSGSISDGVMALYSYSGDCNTLTQIACSDDFDYPGSAHDFLPNINETGLTPGDTLYLRFWGFGSSTGNFGFCLNTATNDDCVDALYICDINGFSASTSAAYTRKHPCNMRANAELNDPPAFTYAPGSNSGGIFGQGGPWGTGSGAFDVRIDNNSWISFTASSASAVLNVSVIDCYVGNYPNGGIQMQIFAATNCCNFVPVSNFQENSTGFTITANNLTIGDDYYLMVDGYAGDICSYTITANSGVQFPDIAPISPICVGESITLNAPPGATSYDWAHDGSTTPSVTVTPPTTMTYSVEVTGLCDYKQTLDVEVEVKPLPNVGINPSSATDICFGESITLTGTGADTYQWNTGSNNTSVTVSPSIQTTYEVTGTTDGCDNTDQITIDVNALPSLTTNPSATDADCGLSNGALTGGVASGVNPFNYEWTNGSGTVVGNNIDLNNVPAGLYTLEVTDNNGCSDVFGPFSIINPGAPAAPTISVTSNAVCDGETVTFTINNPDGNVDYDWSGPNGFNSNATQFDVVITSATDGNYCVVPSENNCTGASACENVTMNPLPSINANADNNGSILCEGSTVSLEANGASTYTWNGPDGFSQSGSPVDINNLTPNQTGWYVVEGTDGNGCTSNDSVFVEIDAQPTANAFTNSDDNAFCEGSFAFLQGSGGGTYSWTGPNGFTSSQQNPILPDFTVSKEGYYVLTVTNENGCTDTDSVAVFVNENLELSLLASDTLVCAGESITVVVSGAENYEWNGPDEFTLNGDEVTIDNFNVDQSGWYYVEGTSEFGCSAADSIELGLLDGTDCFFIPEFLSPNGDNMNDTWIITGIENFPNAEVSIFNRWGNLVFTASPYQNDWIGQVNEGVKIGGESGTVPSGTYYYVIDLKDGETNPFKGYIELQY